MLTFITATRVGSCIGLHVKRKQGYPALAMPWAYSGKYPLSRSPLAPCVKMTPNDAVAAPDAKNIKVWTRPSGLCAKLESNVQYLIK